MNLGNSSSRKALVLLLMLAVGPLQAQTVFACAMMDTVMHDVCCCDGHGLDRDCVDSSCDAAPASSLDPCCERSVEVGFDEDRRQDSPVIKPVEVRSDVDPPQAILALLDAPVLQQTAVGVGVFHYCPPSGPSGSDTYLITQRLRI